MRSTSIALAGLAATAMAMPTAKRASSKGVVGYWGSADGKDLKEYCGDSSGYDTIVLSFIDTFGNGAAPSGGFSEPSDDGYCQIGQGGSGSCPALAADIKTCQDAGKTIILSLGGGASSSYVNSQPDAEGVASTLWNAYGNPDFVDKSANVNRPFGSSFVNGFDLDIEHSDGAGNYKYLVNKLRDLFSQDTSNKYYITAAPQCPLPEANLGDVIQNAQIDKMFTQFYNNWQDCDASNYFGAKAEGASFNYDAWVDYLQGTASKDAELYVGLPASESAATSQSWIDPSDLPKLYDYLKDKQAFAGFMFWEAAESDKYNGNGCTFAQEVKSILTTGGTC